MLLLLFAIERNRADLLNKALKYCTVLTTCRSLVCVRLILYKIQETSELTLTTLVGILYCWTNNWYICLLLLMNADCALLLHYTCTCFLHCTT
jgi:hypothetical protein